MELLKFGKGNAKVGKEVYTFSLPAGWTCPGANECKSFRNHAGKIQDGPNNKFRCFAASDEAQYPNVHDARQHNFKLLRSLDRYKATDLILASLDQSAEKVRIHVSGDFFKLSYLQAWIGVAGMRPNTLFYFYTKSLHFWVRDDILPLIGNGRRPGLIHNVVPTASRGGKYDHLIREYKLREARVVFSTKGRLPIDHDDSHAQKHGGNFALLIHGKQPAGSKSAAALRRLKSEGWNGYGRIPLVTV